LNILSLDGNTVIDSSKWIQVAMKENISQAEWPFLGDFKTWITDGSTGKAYSLQEISKTIEIFDTVNYAGVILYFASESSSSTTINDTISMSSILSYNVNTNSWQFVNTTGQIPSLRSDYTVVSTSDGRVIIYGGTSNKQPANPSIVVLNTSNYVWSTPSEINPIGPFTKHTGNLATITKSILPPSATPNSATPDSKFSSLPNYSSSNNSGLFLGVGVVAAVVIILAFAGFWFYKRSKAKYIATPGSNAIS
ncbi:18906_t:CDS:2, partial [Gigaspora margarita]